MSENDYLISMFIDDELSLDEKVEFVEQVHRSGEFKDETVSLLAQEKDLRSEVRDETPVAVPGPARIRRLHVPPGLGLAAAAVMVIVLSSLFFLLPVRHEPRTVQSISPTPYRFVIYKPEAGRVEITGTFTGWKRVPLEQVGRSGYWEITIRLQPGEHSFTYILDGTRKMADPTIPANEADDFGGVNSILYTGGKA